MNNFVCMDAMFASVLRELSYQQPTGSRNGKAREIFGWSGKLLNPRANLVLNPARKLRGYYAAAELLWYLSRLDDIEMIKAYAPSYEKFADNGKAHGAYGRRWANYDNEGGKGIDQIESVVELLKTKPDTRQAVLSMFWPSDLHFAVGPMPKKDIPCTIAMQFKVCKGKLNMAVFMRSNDSWLGLPYDVFCFTSIQQLVADEIKVEVGEYSHMVGSMHLYEKNLEKALGALKAYDANANLAQPTSNDYSPHSSMEMAVNSALDHEKTLRIDDEVLGMGMKKGTLLRDCVVSCWGHLDHEMNIRSYMSESPLQELTRRDIKDKHDAAN